MAGDSPVGSLGLNGLAIGGHQDGGHEAERTVTLGHNVGLDVPIVVLAGPDEAPVPLDGLGHHVVDEAVLVPDVLGLELLLVLPAGFFFFL